MINNMVLDIETIPDEVRFPAPMACEFVIEPDEVKIPGNISKQETIDAWHKEKKPLLVKKAQEKAEEKALAEYTKAYDDWKWNAVKSVKNQMICIGVSINRSEPEIFFGLDEAELTHRFYSWYASKVNELRKIRWVGYNVRNFDIPIIANRFLKYISPNAMRVVPYQTKPWENDRVYDIMTEFPHSENRIKLDHVASFLGISGKGDVDGSMVYDLYKDGKYDAIQEYQKDDIILTNEVASFMGVFQ